MSKWNEQTSLHEQLMSKWIIDGFSFLPYVYIAVIWFLQKPNFARKCVFKRSKFVYRFKLSLKLKSLLHVFRRSAKISCVRWRFCLWTHSLTQLNRPWRVRQTSPRSIWETWNLFGRGERYLFPKMHSNAFLRLVPNNCCRAAMFMKGIVCYTSPSASIPWKIEAKCRKTGMKPGTCQDIMETVLLYDRGGVTGRECVWIPEGLGFDCLNG